jgi:site-specific DNA-methyltransferase (adenine-specific)
MKAYYKDKYSKLIQADSFDYMQSLPDNCLDNIITDPPYFLSNDGFSNRGGKRVSVNKGDWDRGDSEYSDQFYKKLLNYSNKILKENGTLWIFGSMHNIYKLGYLLPKYNFKIINNITWQKSNPAPNLSKRMFTHSTETILWAKKINGKQIYNYDLMRKKNNNRQMKDVWTTPTINKCEKRFGYHPTQKPLSVLIRIIQASTTKESLILDPFIGSGTTAVAGKLLERRVIGVDTSLEYLDIAKKRIKNFRTEPIGKIK